MRGREHRRGKVGWMAAALVVTLAATMAQQAKADAIMFSTDFYVNGVPVNAGKLADGTQNVEIGLTATLVNLLDTAVFQVSPVAAATIGNVAEGDYVSWDANAGLGPVTLDSAHQSVTFFLPLTSTGYSDGDGDSWMFTFPMDALTYTATVSYPSGPPPSVINGKLNISEVFYDAPEGGSALLYLLMSGVILGSAMFFGNRKAIA